MSTCLMRGWMLGGLALRSRCGVIGGRSLEGKEGCLEDLGGIHQTPSLDGRWHSIAGETFFLTKKLKFSLLEKWKEIRESKYLKDRLMQLKLQIKRQRKKKDMIYYVRFPGCLRKK